MKDVTYAYRRDLQGVAFDDAVARTTEALMTEGFGVLTVVDVQATLKAKLRVDHRPYKILGACNPPLAHRALTAEPAIGLFLPCNVVVAQTDNGSEVAIGNPKEMFKIVDNQEMQSLADEVDAKLRAVLERI